MSYNKVPPDPSGGGGGGGSVNSVAVTGTGLVLTGTASDPILATSAATNASLGKADTALQPAGNLTGTVNGVAVATVTAGAALGAAAVQPATSPTLSGLTVTNGSNATIAVSDAASFIALRGTPATAGQLRCTNNSGLVSRNAGNTANIRIAQVDATDQLLLGPFMVAGDALPANVVYDVDAAGAHKKNVNGATILTIAATLVTIAAAASLRVSSLGVGVGHYDGSGNLTSSTIVNADVNAAAAIAGTKINPDFGAQNITTTGTATTAKITVTQAVATSGSPSAVVVTGAAHTTLAASTEAPDVSINLARTVQFATGNFAIGSPQRAIKITAPTYNSVAASTMAVAATLAISGAPVAVGNMAITDSFALFVESGAIGLNHGQKTRGKNNAGTAFVDLFDWGTAVANTLLIGQNGTMQTIIGATSTITFQAAGISAASITGAAFTLSTPTTITFGSAVVAPKITQTIDATASVTCDNLGIEAQSGSGTTAVTAGDGFIKGGSATGASGTRNGGNAWIQPGTGATANGASQMRNAAGTKVVEVNSTGLGLFGVAPVAQPADVGAITDSTGGATDGTLVDVGVAFSQANINNNFADLALKYNNMRTNVLRALGLTA